MILSENSVTHLYIGHQIHCASRVSMISLRQKNISLQEFCAKVYAYSSLLLYKTCCLDIGEETINLLSRTYGNKAKQIGIEADVEIFVNYQEFMNQ